MKEPFSSSSILRKNSRRPEVFCKKVFPEILKIQGKTPVPGTFFQRNCRPKSSLWHRCFPVNLAKFLRTPFLTEHLQRLPLEKVARCYLLHIFKCSNFLSWLNWQYEIRFNVNMPLSSSNTRSSFHFSVKVPNAQLSIWKARPDVSKAYSFDHQSHKMVKHTQTLKMFENMLCKKQSTYIRM